jgi:hypothetical protein
MPGISGAAGLADCHTAATSMNAVAERLTSLGLKVVFPHRPESRRLTVTSTSNLRCDVIIDDDNGAAECAIAPATATTAAQVAPVVAGMLGTGYPDPGHYAALHRGMPLAGGVAREMTARGLRADMDVIEDHESYQVFADVIITNPARPERGRVHIGDDGWICWECDRDDIPGGNDAFAGIIASFLTATPPGAARGRLRDRLRRLPARRGKVPRP